jgi:hypothetical protein
MKKKQKKDKKPRSAPVNHQIPLSQIRKITLTGPRYYLKHAREYPIVGCWVYADWQESGIAPVVVAREHAPGKVLFCVCMIDLYCLGIKDCFAKADISRNAFERELPKMCANQPQECSVEFAHEMIYGGMEYAKTLGFDPHPDFINQMVNLVLDPPDAHPRVENIEFGKNGQPFYVAGPYDDERKINRVLNTLTRTAGEGNFHYLASFDGPDFDDDWDNGDWEDHPEDAEEYTVEDDDDNIIDAEVKE